MKHAKFAVVGHPNKGKSSIVSTLSHNDSIRISSRSGTTNQASSFHVETSRSGYELIDTPGFQRPSKVLTWLKKHAARADQRAQAVADLVADRECQQRFPDEVKLLRPLVEGAAILYVVDGSRPFGIEYEAEMEILQWSGQPSMALINPIESEAFVDSWSNALAQYFKTVRVFNPVTAEFKKQTDLLLAFAHLKPEWAQQLNLVTEDLRAQRKLQKRDSALVLTRLIEDLCFYQQSQKVLTKKQAEQIQPVLAKEYQRWMVRREGKAIRELFAIYQHYQSNVSIEDLSLPPDLFDYEQWYMWGLSKKQLMTAGIMTGAAAGMAIDVAVAGHSLMLGAIGGGLLGFGSAWLGADKLVKTKLKDLPLGGYQASYGPVKNKNFPYVVIGRFVFLHSQISQRNHALRGQMDIANSELQLQIDRLEKSEQKMLHQLCNKLVKQKTVDDATQIFSSLL